VTLPKTIGAIIYACFSIEINEVETSIEKPASLTLPDFFKILLESRKTFGEKRWAGSYPRK